MKKLYLHPISIAIINKQYADAVKKGILYLQDAFHLGKQIRSAYGRSKNIYTHYIQAVPAHDMSEAQWSAAGHYLYQQHIQLMCEFIDILMLYRGLGTKEAIIEFYEYYDIDPYDFDWQTAKKAWQRSKQSTVSKLKIYTVLEYNKVNYYKELDNIYNAHPSLFHKKTGEFSNAKLHTVTLYILHKKFSFSYSQIAIMQKLNKSNVHTSISSFELKINRLNKS
jgi:hypothetical protein